MLEFLLGLASGALAIAAYQSCSHMEKIYAAFTRFTEGGACKNFAIFAFDYGSTLVEQCLRRSVVKDGKMYIVRYILNGRLYEINVKPVVGPAAARMTPKERGERSLSPCSIPLRQVSTS